MRALPALAVLAILLAGCAAEPKADAGGAAAASGASATDLPYNSGAVPLRFAGGDYEGNLTGTATFSIAAQCIFNCMTGGEQVVDLTPVIPPNAPVELGIEVVGANCMITYADTYAIGVEDGQRCDLESSKASFAGIFIRADAGKVELHIYNPGGFSAIPPEPAPAVEYSAHGAVRAGLLVPQVPAAIALKPGERLNLTGGGVEEALLIAPDGAVTRKASAPFELVANGTAGLYTLLMLGSEASAVHGPNVTMAAKRLARVEDGPHALASGGTAWGFSPEGIPLLVGLTVQSGRSPVDPFGGGMPSMTAFSTGWSLAITAPGSVEVLREDESFCSPFCGGGFQYTTSTDFLDERLRPGEYGFSVTFEGSGAEAYAFAVVIV